MCSAGLSRFQTKPVRMNYQKRHEIHDLAGRVRAALRLPGPRLDVVAAVKMIGGQIETSRSPFVEACVRKKGQAFVIELSGDVNDERTRFSVAHELGHVFLHMGYMVDPATWNGVDEYRDSPMFRMGHSEEELQANEFAAGLLMPEGEFRAVAIQHLRPLGFELSGIAKAFGVSVPAARNRGRWLGLFSWD